MRFDNLKSVKFPTTWTVSLGERGERERERERERSRRERVVTPSCGRVVTPSCGERSGEPSESESEFQALRL